MREYRIVEGKYSDTYNIYDGREEYDNSKHKDIPIHKWNELNPLQVNKGDYMEALDGYILPVLNKYIYKNRYGFTFPNGSFMVYATKNGYKFQRFYGQFTNGDRYSYGGKSLPRRILTKDREKKIRFVTMIVSGISAEKAVYLTYGAKPINTYYKIVGELMADEEVREELIKQTDSFIQTFDNKTKELFNVERLTNELDSLLKYSAKGTKDHRENIDYIMKLVGLINQSNKVKAKNPVNIVDTEFEDLPPDEV